MIPMLRSFYPGLLLLQAGVRPFQIRFCPKVVRLHD